MLAQHYAQALTGVKTEDAVSNLVAVLKKKGHLMLLPSILREYKKLLEEKGVQKGTTIRFAKGTNLKGLRACIEQYEGRLEFSLKDARVVEDPSIVGGFVIEQADREVDGSYRARLIELYRKLMAVSI